MSIQTRIIERGYPKAVSARANQTLRNEASKGCVENIYNSPVSLEPNYKPPIEWNQISNEFLHADPIKRVAKHKKIIRQTVQVYLNKWIYSFFFTKLYHQPFGSPADTPADMTLCFCSCSSG